MVISMLTTLGARRDSHHEFPDRRSYKVTKAIDPGVTWTHIEHEIEGIERKSVSGDLACWCHPRWCGTMFYMPHVTRIHTFHRPYVPIKMWHVSPTIGSMCPLCLVACHLWKLPIWSMWLEDYLGPTCIFIASSTSPRARVGHSGVWDSGGLGGNVMGKVKGLKVRAMWRDFETSGL